MTRKPRSQFTDDALFLGAIVVLVLVVLWGVS